MSIYIPPKSDEPPQKPTFGVKFSNDIFLSKTWLDDHNISYEPGDIEQTPLGPCARFSK